MSTLDPAIKSFEAFGLAIKGAAQAASGDFSGAKKSIEEAKNAAKSAGKELLNIPKEISAAYSKADAEMKAVNQLMEIDAKKRNEKIKDSFADLFGYAVKESKKAGEDIDKNLGGDGDPVDATAEAEEARKEKLKGLEKEINDMKLKALRAQANGDKEAQGSMERRAKLAQRIVDIMKEFNVSQEEATLLANKTAEGGDITGEIEKRSSLSGRELKAASDLAGKGKGENGEDIRFDRLAGGGFQQFVGGKKGKKFSEAEMQAGLQKQIDKDPSEALLEKINQTLEGKFVSQ